MVHCRYRTWLQTMYCQFGQKWANVERIYRAWNLKSEREKHNAGVHECSSLCIGIRMYVGVFVVI